MTVDKRTARRPEKARALQLAVGATLVYAAVCGIIAIAQGGNAEWFLKLGRNDPKTVERAREILGHDDVNVPFVDHHDGAQFWLLARDPLLLDPRSTDRYLDSGIYRAQRIWYPLTAAPFRLGGEQSLLWGLVMSNLVAVGIGTYLTSLLASELLAPARAGLALAVNPLVIAGVMLDLADVWALTGLLGVVLAMRRGHYAWAVTAGSMAVLSREVMLIALAGVALGAVGRPVWARIRLVVIPSGIAILWYLYVHARMSEGTPIIAYAVVPFSGWTDAYMNSWSAYDRWADFAVALVVLAIAVSVVIRFLTRRTLELWAAVPFCFLLPFTSGQVISNSTNSTRTLGAPLTLLLLDLYANRREIPVRWPRLPARFGGPIRKVVGPSRTYFRNGPLRRRDGERGLRRAKIGG